MSNVQNQIFAQLTWHRLFRHNISIDWDPKHIKELVIISVMKSANIALELARHLDICTLYNVVHHDI